MHLLMLNIRYLHRSAPRTPGGAGAARACRPIPMSPTLIPRRLVSVPLGARHSIHRLQAFRAAPTSRGDERSANRLSRAMSRIPALSKRSTGSRRRERPKSHRIMREYSRISVRTKPTPRRALRRVRQKRHASRAAPSPVKGTTDWKTAVMRLGPTIGNGSYFLPRLQPLARAPVVCSPLHNDRCRDGPHSPPRRSVVFDVMQR